MRFPRAAVIAAIVLAVAACVPRERINTDCRWNDPRSGPLDLASSRDRDHLRVDLDVAEELAVAHGDSVRHARDIWIAVAASRYRQAVGGSYSSIGRTSDSPSNSGQ